MRGPHYPAHEVEEGQHRPIVPGDVRSRIGVFDPHGYRMILIRADRRFDAAGPVDAVPAAELRAWLLELRPPVQPAASSATPKANVGM